MKGIYSITCISTGEKYIGQSISIKRRWATHKRELKKGVHYNKHLQRAYDKYGESNFLYEILELCSEEKLNEREKFYIQIFDSHKNGFNQDDGGSDISGEKNPMYMVKGKDAPRFKDYILQLDLEGNIINTFESSCEAASFISGNSKNTSGILKCLYTWQGKTYGNRRAFTYRGYQWIYEQDYYKLLPFYDFSTKNKWKGQNITVEMVNKGALSGDI